MKIYQIDSSARKEGSTSRALAKKVLEKIKKPGDDIETPNNEASPLGRAIKRASNFFLLGA